ncbi:GNAT family N-acetyltransferase [Liquorilactobacillus vini]|uniref:GNAT family N-acetyltransferase n=1 Tax=Liquorilactobacillus vini TaxID=238015 RepID=UPI0007055322
MVGLIRVIGDGASIIYIQDILILPTYQRKGIGSDLIKRILALYPDYYQINLLTSDEKKTSRSIETSDLSLLTS